MKKIKYLVFTIFISLIFVGGVCAKDLTCEVGKYTITYSKSGVLKGIKHSDKNISYSRLKSDFQPTKKSKCPTNKNARVVKKEEGSAIVYYVQKIFICEVENYTLKYSSEGDFIEVTDPYDNKWDKRRNSEFQPTEESECPTDKTAEIVFSSGEQVLNVVKKKSSSSDSSSNSSSNSSSSSSSSTSSDEKRESGEKDITCEVNGYKLTYTSKGEIVSAEDSNGKKVNKRLESNFHPKKESECPTDETAIISYIDGSRTLYVAKIDESFGDPQITQDLGGCVFYDNIAGCTKNDFYSCLWIENTAAPGDAYCNVDNLLFVGCGGASDIPEQVPALISFFVNFLKILTPIILIFVSIITLLKALASQKEDEIKKAQSSLIQKIIAAVMIFFVISIVQFVISKVAEDDDEYTNFSNCLNCFLNNKCEVSTYYKTSVGETDYCTPLTTGKTDECGNLFK